MRWLIYWYDPHTDKSRYSFPPAEEEDEEEEEDDDDSIKVFDFICVYIYILRVCIEGL